MNKGPWKTRLQLVMLLVFTVVFAAAFGGPAPALAAEVTVTVSEADGSVPGQVRVSVNKQFPDGSIVSVSGPGVETFAVVAEGRIEFRAPQYGDYRVGATQKNIRDYWMDSMRTEDMSVGTYKGDGSVGDPYTLISTFADVPMEIFKLQAAWKGYNYLAGYPTIDSPNDADYVNSFDAGHVAALLVEDRDQNTGRLRGSFFVDGRLWLHTTGSDKGPYYMNYLLDPTDAYITSGYALDNHYLYGESIPEGAARKEAAVQKIKSVRDAKTSALFFSYRMRDFSGPILFTVDVSESGKFRAGDVVSVHYLLGASDRNLFHGLKPDPATLIAQEPTFRKHYQDAGLTATVDGDGYLAFNLYSGGYFELRNETAIQEHRAVTVAPKVYETVKVIDVDTTHWAYDSITAMVEKNFLSAEGGTFMPDKVITRGEFIKGLVLACEMTIVSGKTEFADVPKSSPLNDYVYTAFQAGIARGVSNTQFGVDSGLPHEAALVLIGNALDIKPGTDDFTAIGDILARTAGYPGGNLEARHLLTRAEAAVLLDGVDQWRK